MATDAEIGALLGLGGGLLSGFGSLQEREEERKRGRLGQRELRRAEGLAFKETLSPEQINLRNILTGQATEQLQSGGLPSFLAPVTDFLSRQRGNLRRQARGTSRPGGGALQKQLANIDENFMQQLINLIIQGRQQAVGQGQQAVALGTPRFGPGAAAFAFRPDALPPGFLSTFGNTLGATGGAGLGRSIGGGGGGGGGFLSGLFES
jgi:hypothetical protein